MAASRSGAFPGSGSTAPASRCSARAAMIAVGALTLDEAYRVIDWNTITLLLGMMIVVAHLKVSGAFRALGALAIEHAHAPVRAADDGDDPLRGPLGLPRQRRDLSGDGADRRADHAGDEPQPRALSRRDGDRLELRQRRHDHRQSPEHGDRRDVRHFLSGLLRRARRRSRSSASSWSSSSCAWSIARSSAPRRRSIPLCFAAAFMRDRWRRRASSASRSASRSSPASLRRAPRSTAAPSCCSPARSSRIGSTARSTARF